ncbi:CotH kinase family protein [Chryseobacterium sp. MEBOG07]|uniref:CotH kinase family protein n=1 Tax=Chryseobacterium sp. MEBOG07 TaxID=2879939 RepID=UPI001F33B024|nr:CotH kinase family protein [Chryseobacterium sp. MEBOG07]UKB81260.1 CotH kinase family protein [Chryseobacterium sp. MEBOG07]
MRHIFSSVPGDPGSLVFQFNGQFALKNYNVEIINGNRLKVTSAQNELFSLLEVDVTEVEINGIIYNDAGSAQIALQSLVFSEEIPVVLSANDRAAIMAGYKGSINKSTPTPSKEGFYLCEESGVYPHINNLEALDHFVSFFTFDGSTWSVAKIEIPGGNVADHFDPTNSTEAQGGKQIANRYDHLLKISDGFFEKVIPDHETAVTIGATSAIFGGKFLQPDNALQNNGQYPNIGVVHNFPIEELTYRLEVQGMINIGNNNLPAILGIKKDNSIITLLNYADADFTGLHKFNTADLKAVSIQVVDGAFPTIQLYQYEKQWFDARKYSDDRFATIDFCLNPVDQKWSDLSIPQPDEHAGAFLNTSWQQYPVSGLNNGEILLSNMPADIDQIQIEGVAFNIAGAGILWLGAINTKTGLKVQLLKGSHEPGVYTFPVEREKYDKYVYSRIPGDQKFKIRTTTKLPIKKDSVKDYIDNHISSGSIISNEKKAQIKRPTKLLRLDFTTPDSLPVDKTTKASGVVLISDMEGLGLKKFATIEVQGSSSAIYPKKNWTIALFNNESKTDEFKLRVGNWVEHSEFVFKSNWIDATHARNLISNKIWEDIVQSRTDFPKRENEVAYIEGNTTQLGRFDSGALTHVDGVPAELYINGTFYGIGNFNIGKKRDNYDLKSSNQNHIQIAAEDHASFYSYVPAQWEIRNPKTPDADFQTKINAWFASNLLSGSAFKANFETNHNLRNAIDVYLLAEFIMSVDMFDKNLIVTSWDGVKFYFLPYDMDTTFGLRWDGSAFDGWSASIRSASFWQKFYNAYSVEIKARYADLKSKGVFTLNNVYKHADLINKTFGLNSFTKEQAKWPDVPSNSIIYTGYNQIYDWTKNRIAWLDSQYS